MDKPCSKCAVTKTYYESPCWTCLHNPRTPEEILESCREEIFRKRHDAFKLTNESPVTVLSKKDGVLETYKCGSCQKNFLTVEGHLTSHCAACGRKINYGDK